MFMCTLLELILMCCKDATVVAKVVSILIQEAEVKVIYPLEKIVSCLTMKFL